MSKISSKNTQPQVKKPRARKKKSVLVGSFLLGHEVVDLFADFDNEGGCFYFAPGAPEEQLLPRIRISIQTNWAHALQILVHEALEFLLTRYGQRYIPCGKTTGDHGNYLFIFSHVQFTEACSKLGTFLAAAVPPLLAVHEKHQPKAK